MRSTDLVRVRSVCQSGPRSASRRPWSPSASGVPTTTAERPSQPGRRQISARTQATKSIDSSYLRMLHHLGDYADPSSVLHRGSEISDRSRQAAHKSGCCVSHFNGAVEIVLQDPGNEARTKTHIGGFRRRRAAEFLPDEDEIWRPLMIFDPPANRHMTARHSQSAVLQGVGGKLVDRQRQGQSLPGFDDKRGTRDRKPAFARPVGGQRGVDHILQRCFRPIFCREHVVRSSERRQSSKILFEIGLAGCVAKCLGGHRTKYCKRVLDAVLELLIDEVQRFPCHVLGRDILADDKHAAHLAFEIDRTKTVRPPDILATAVTRYRYQLVHIPGRSFARHDVVDLRANDVPYLIPALAAACSQGARMPFGPHRLAIGIVVELDEFRSPPNEHRMSRGEHEPHRNPKTLRPCPGRTERGVRPVKSSRQSAHLAAARQEVADYLTAHTRNLTQTLVGNAIAGASQSTMAALAQSCSCKPRANPAARRRA